MKVRTIETWELCIDRLKPIDGINNKNTIQENNDGSVEEAQDKVKKTQRISNEEVKLNQKVFIAERILRKYLRQKGIHQSQPNADL